MSTNEIAAEAVHDEEHMEVNRLEKELSGYEQQLVLAKEAQTAAVATLNEVTTDTQTGVMSQDDVDTYAAAKLHLDLVNEFCTAAELACHDAMTQLNAARHNLEARV